MILQALTKYFHRISQSEDSDVAQEGFQKQGIPFIIVLNHDGCFAGLQDTRQGDGKKKQARIFTVPKGVKRASNIAANLLWDNPAYVLGRPKPDKKKDSQSLLERSKEQHQRFIETIKESLPSSLSESDHGIAAVLSFLEKGDFEAVFTHGLWPEIEAGGANLTFQLEGETQLVCQRQLVVSALMNAKNDNGEVVQACLITGDEDIPARLHTSIKGVWGAQSSGANIVSFNLDAFRSYGKTQGYNAPVGKKAEFAYTTALNTLLAKDSRQRLQVGDASTVFWAEKENKMEEVFADFFGEPPKGQSEQDNQAIKALFKSPEIGAPPLLDDDTKFYVLGLSPNAARIAIRFWYQGSVGEVAQHIKRHFEDCSIVRSPKDPEFLSLFRLLVSTAVQGKSDNIQPNLAGNFMKAILSGTPYPQTLLSSAVRRIRAEREITYPRASLIKAVLVRDTRFFNKTDKEVSMALDKSNTNQGYLLGRLFSVLERAQESASPGINATIRDRFYGSASSTPVAVFPHLMKLKNHHIAKLDNKGQAINLEKLMGEIIDGVQDFPSHLSLADQGRFAVGYYHQRQDFFTKKDKTNPKEDNSNE